ncbi:VOC family protein [Paucibacter sp. Y2R2-4]|uniref:VOC family protein n=1 Tax=Paucibacter sp. Y2R2-4 TaxID=2893553 RepID=UPI0021E3C5D1|nr:VOC family protein [Paucibacter sp. Y2R2-4]MCV2350856.1 VOC family protein [Paucibacter sp. Y2R2-4]
MSLQLDHLVIGAASLVEGEAWCEATLGVKPSSGGKHVLMSTHNRLLQLSSEAFPRCYLEIIAIDPEAPPPGRARWFDLDESAMRARLAHGPGLIHWVARSNSLEASLADWQAHGLDAGPAVAASRMTPAGELRWRIALRADGRRLLNGALPLLIEWGEVHPSDSLPSSGVSLLEFSPTLPQPDLLAGLAAKTGDPNVQMRLQTPRGEVSLKL